MSNRNLLKQFADGTPLTPAGINHLIECSLLTKTDNGGIVLTSAGILLLNSDLPPGDSASCPDDDSYLPLTNERLARHEERMVKVRAEDLRTGEVLGKNLRTGDWVEVLAENLRPGRIEFINPGRSERDPHGKHQHETGAKLDAGKPRLGLVLCAFANALVEVGKVGTYGAQKYTDNGWLDVPKGKARYTDALLRHVLAETNETHDPDTNLLHAAHAAWNALARLELVLRKRGELE